jgi:hypothetical protein
MTRALESIRRPSGRPRTPAGEAYSETIVVKLTPPQMEAVRNLATHRGHCAVSVYVRQLVMAHVEAERQRAGAPQKASS